MWPLHYMKSMCTVVHVVIYYYPEQLNTELEMESSTLVPDYRWQTFSHDSMTNENVGNGWSCGSHFLHTHTYLWEVVQGNHFMWQFTLPLHSGHFVQWQTAQYFFYSSFFVCQDQCILVHCIAVYTRFLLTIFKETAVNIFFQLADLCHV